MPDPIRNLVSAIIAAAVLLAAGIGCQSTSVVRGQTPEFFEPTDEPLAEEPSDEQRTISVDEPLVEVLVEGHKTVEATAVLQRVKTQQGRPADETQVREDIRTLYETKWFFSVEARYRRTDDGLVLVFRVVERPMITRIEYRGNKHVKKKKLDELITLKVGGPFDVNSNREAARRIEDHYHEKGYATAKVELLKGGSKDDREVLFDIAEGNKLVVDDVDFVGNEAFSGQLLKIKLRTKKAILGIPFLGGKYDPATIPDDINALKQYYQGLGYFDVKIEHKVAVNEASRLNPVGRGVSYVTIEYHIEEGIQYQIRGIEVTGNDIFTEADIKGDLKLTSGEKFNARLLNKDVEAIKDRYGELGRLYAQVDAVPRFLEDAGVIDLVYKIDESNINTIRRVNVHIEGDYPHTKETVVLNRVLIHPGDLANPKLIQRSKRRLEGQMIFEHGPQNGPKVSITPVQKDTLVADSVVRGQSEPLPLPTPPNPIFENNPYGDPFGRAIAEPPGQVDLDFYVSEARTGRLMFGVGVNSDAGVVGSIVLEENNFDITRAPTSWRDVIDGYAWRGDGQRFRIEAVPGNVVSRYLVSWSDPYFLNTDFSFSTSGFYYNRFFPDWDEDRFGGRLSLGRQLTQEWSVSGSLRLEEIQIRNPDSTLVPLLNEAVGESFFTSGRLSVSHDTRDAPFLPAEGHFVQASYEHAFGDFSYPKFEVEGRQYFTIYSRPDGGGRHVLSTRLEAGWTGDETPIFERYFAGGYQSFRGFAFRGVSPIAPEDPNIRIGGRFQFLGSVEYQVPITADETVSVVGFSDFGTVEDDAGIDTPRVSVGGGLRLLIPAMGPAPIALDWAYPVLLEDTDDRRLFSFYIGITR